MRPTPLLGAALVVLAAGVVAALTRPAPADAVAAIHPEGIVLIRSSTAGPAVLLDEGALAPTTTTTTTAALPPPVPTTAPPPPPTMPPPRPAPPSSTAAAPAPTPAAPAPPPTTAAPAPAPAPAADVDASCERDLFERTNAARAQRSLAPLAFDARVHDVARDWSREMAAARRMSHNPNLGADLTAAGVDWRTAGENVGHGSPATVFAMWMDSPSHRANILGTAYGTFAVACITTGPDLWITQTFVG